MSWAVGQNQLGRPLEREDIAIAAQNYFQNIRFFDLDLVRPTLGGHVTRPGDTDRTADPSEFGRNLD